MEELSIISLAERFLNVGEEDGSIVIPVERTGNLSEEVSFSYSIILSSAENGEDFISSRGRLTFAANQDRIEIVVPILDDDIAELDETFSVQIGGPSEGAVLDFIRTALVTIEDNDPVPANTVGFSQGEYTIAEDGGQATITVTRTANPSEVAQVEYVISGDSAREGKDYIGTSGILEFSANQNTQSFTIPIVNDDLVELNESLRVTLSNPVGTSLGPQSSARLIINEESTSSDVFWQKAVIGGLDSEGGLDSPGGPVVFDWTPDGTQLLIGTLDGVVRTFENGKLQVEPFIDISSRVNDGGQRGMIGLAIHPNFPSTPYVYLAYSYDPPNVPPDLSADAPRTTRLVRVTADPTTNFRTAVPGSEEILLETEPIGNFHAAGAIKFDTNGDLIFTHGDGIIVSERTSLAKTQKLLRLDNVIGKMLRIDPISGEGLPDNPFYVPGQPNAIQSKILNYGLRNPWRYALHPETGEPFIGDVGGIYWEEINRGVGQNFGWSLYEGGNGVSLRNPDKAQDPVFQDLFDTYGNSVTAPVYAESHALDNASAIVVGDFYTGSNYPDLYQGALFFTDFTGSQDGLLKALVFDEQGNLDSAIPVGFTDKIGTTYLEMGPDGNLWYANLLSGEVGYWNYEPAGNGSPTAPILTSPTAVNFPENETTVLDVEARDANGDTEDNQGLTYSLNGGVDLEAFQIDAATGLLSFAQVPDPSNPVDSNRDNVYEVEVTVSDSTNRTDSDLIYVTVGSETFVSPPTDSSEFLVEMIDTATGQAIATIENGTQLLLSEISGQNLTLSASVPATSSTYADVESAFINYNDGAIARQDNFDPYTLFGDFQGQDYFGGVQGQSYYGNGPFLAAGDQTISFDLYSSNNLGGTSLGTVTRNFTVVDDLAPTDSSEFLVEMIDTATGQAIATIENGTQLLLSEISGQNLTLSASVPDTSSTYADVESAFINYNDGAIARQDNFDPYTLFGDFQGQDYFGGVQGQSYYGNGPFLAAGEQTISFDLYSSNNLSGTSLGTVTRNFTVVDDLAL